ncbi:hypothetical protein pb186bvf_007214 [Paramecium bursaria]
MITTFQIISQSQLIIYIMLTNKYENMEFIQICPKMLKGYQTDLASLLVYRVCVCLCEFFLRNIQFNDFQVGLFQWILYMLFLLFINLIGAQEKIEWNIKSQNSYLMNVCMIQIRMRVEKDKIQLFEQIQDDDDFDMIFIQYFEYCMDQILENDFKFMLHTNLKMLDYQFIFNDFQIQRWNADYQLTELQQLYSSYIKSYDKYNQELSVQFGEADDEQVEQTFYLSKFRIFLIGVWIYVISICSCIFIRRRRFLKKAKN